MNERLYKSKLGPDELKREVLDLNLNKKITIRADGSRPELIKMIRDTGLLIEGVDKAQKNDRILLLSAENISVTRSSTNIIREKDGYVWKKANDGSNKDVPIEVDDHSMDASLYSADKVVIRIIKRSTSWGSSRTT